MTTYRTGNHWGVTIVAETPIDEMTAVDAQLVAVVVNGDQALAEQICDLLNLNANPDGQPDPGNPPASPPRTPRTPEPVPEVDRGTPAHPKPGKRPSGGHR